MSQRINAIITCHHCNKQFEFTLYRSIWGEYPENRELVMSDKINVATCPYCGTMTKLSYPFIYTNAKQLFAVWWEPYYDPQIDKDKAGYEKMLGKGDYLATAPRVKDWNEFKQTIIQFEKSNLKANPANIGSDIRNNKNDFLKEKKGCFSFLALLIMGVFIFGCKILG